MVSSSSGSADLMKISYSELKSSYLENELSWKDIHYFKNGDQSSCTALAVYDTDIVTVGEDGCINLLSIQSPKVLSRKGILFVCTFNFNHFH